MPFPDNCQFEVETVSLENLPDLYQLSGEWTITQQYIAESVYTMDNNEIPVAQVTLEIERSWLFYAITVVGPMMLTSVMATFVFLIPEHTGEKVSFLVNMFVSDAVFLNFIAGAIPRSMNLLNVLKLPRITLFLLAVMVEKVFALLATIFVISRYNKERGEKAKRSEDLLYKILAEMMKQDSKSDISANKNEKETISTTKDEKIPIPTFGVGSSSDNARTFLFLLMQRKNVSTKRIRKLFASYAGTKVSLKRSCCIKAKHWDLIFFFAFSLASIPFYTLLTNIPGPSTNSSNVST
ncbi:acetylcholine receptor subunit alpha-like 2 [Biomphalaria glabrata]|uniref:Acetylcholine receptor subunit alpha-like 2 n=1 Tax=Biomphalaria glabrata TaxID=6526 RepID=A0A9W3BME6_BIOGL|nr:acetylcholine receptor subunit alpha-like 2 [Biomphalaria glabrata]